MRREKILTLEEALRVVNGVVEFARENNHRGVAVVVVDKHGKMIAAAKMTGLADRVLGAAHRKAYSAAKFERDTSLIIDMYREAEASGQRGPHDWNDPMLSTLPGGMCVLHDGEVVGAVAVAGGGGNISDWQFAEKAFSLLGEGFEHRGKAGVH
jgi:glc operon protein GlcG